MGTSISNVVFHSIVEQVGREFRPRELLELAVVSCECCAILLRPLVMSKADCRNQQIAQSFLDTPVICVSPLGSGR